MRHVFIPNNLGNIVEPCSIGNIVAWYMSSSQQDWIWRYHGCTLHVLSTTCNDYDRLGIAGERTGMYQINVNPTVV